MKSSRWKFLIDVNRYNEKDLWELANLIGGVFLLDQKVTPEIYHQRLLNLTPILKHYGKPVMEMFLNWFVTVMRYAMSPMLAGIDNRNYQAGRSGRNCLESIGLLKRFLA
jgi:hypothetical protein